MESGGISDGVVARAIALSLPCPAVAVLNRRGVFNAKDAKFFATFRKVRIRACSM